MVLASELRRLAESQGWGGAVVSLYLDTRFSETAQPRQLRSFWNEKRREAERSGVDKAVLARLDAELDSLVHATGRTLPRGLALFAGPLRFETVALPSRTSTEFSVGRRPSLFRLAQANSGSERVLVAQVSQHQARLLELVGENLVSDQTIDLEGAVHSPTHGEAPLPKDEQGDMHRQRKYDLLAERLTYLFDRQPCRVVVSGTRQVACEFQDRLPKRLAERSAIVANYKDIPELVDRVREMIAYQALGEVVAQEARIYREAQAGLSGALGLKDVLLALQEGRVHELLLTDRFEAVGCQCLQCGALDARAGLSCHYCGGPIETGSLRDPIVERALTYAALIRVVADHPRHRMVGGICAQLRPNRAAAGLPEMGVAE